MCLLFVDADVSWDSTDEPDQLLVRRHADATVPVMFPPWWHECPENNSQEWMSNRGMLLETQELRFYSTRLLRVNIEYEGKITQIESPGKRV